MDPSTTTYSIGELAGAVGVGVETIRFYERRGVLPEPPRTAGGYRVYSATDRWRLDFIRRAKRLGFTLKEIAALLGAGEQRRVDEVRHVAERRLAEVETELRDLARRRELLRDLVATCTVGPGDLCLDLDLGAGAATPSASGARRVL